MTTRRYEPPGAPVASRPAVKRVVARKPPRPKPTRRYEPLPKAPVKQMFRPNVKLDASQVVDRRQAPRPPGRNIGKAIGRAVRYEAAIRAWRAKAAAVDRRRPAPRVGKARAI
jgi:hypothetical protein